MKKALLLLLFFSSFFFGHVKAQLSVGCQQGLELWYAADTGVTSSGSGVTAWADRKTSSVTYNLTNTGASSTFPSYNTDQLNGHPTVGFDGGDVLYNTSVLASDFKDIAYTSCYIVLNSTSAGKVFQHGKGSNRVVFRTNETRWGGNGADNTVSFTSSVGSDYEVKTWLVSSEIGFPPNNQIYQISTDGKVEDDETQGSSVNVFTATDSFTLGLRDNSFQGEIAELMVFKSEHYLASSTKDIIETYMSLKYGISKDNSGGNKAYRNKNGVTLWNYSTDCGNGAYSTFSNRVTGIFRDDCFGTLEFNKSTNSTGTSTSVLTGALTDNGGSFANPNGFSANYQAFLWGDNGSSLNFANSSDAPTSFTRLNRVWKVAETLNSSTIGNITFEIDLSGTDINAGTNQNDVIVIIDRNNDGDFTDAGTDETINLSSWNGTTKIGQFTADFDNCETFSVAVRSTALPVTWARFEAVAGDNSVDIAWTTSVEINNSHFEVQRSVDGNNWETLGTMSGQGTKTGHTDYDFVDYSPEIGTNIYRIKQIDFDGNESYSIHREVVFAGYFILENISLYPNPATDLIKLDLPFNVGKIQVSITDLAGNELITETYGGAEAQLNVANLSKGMYLVKVSKGNASRVTRILVE